MWQYYSININSYWEYLLVSLDLLTDLRETNLPEGPFRIRRGRHISIAPLRTFRRPAGRWQDDRQHRHHPTALPPLSSSSGALYNQQQSLTFSNRIEPSTVLIVYLLGRDSDVRASDLRRCWLAVRLRRDASAVVAAVTSSASTASIISSIFIISLSSRLYYSPFFLVLVPS